MVGTMLRWFVIAGFLGLVAASSAGRAQDDPFAAFNCERAHEGARYPAAVDACRPLADDGLADAQAIMGVLYQNGQGLPQDYTQAAQWYDRAA
jgi:TPR repeat protein